MAVEAAGETSQIKKQAIHPITFRLKDSSSLSVTSPVFLKSAGLASLTTALFTLFRPTPLILYLITAKFRKISPGMDKFVVIVFLFSWSGLIMFVLIILGILLLASDKIKKRGVLMLHPWGLLLLYLDMFVWISLITWMHIVMMQAPGMIDRLFDDKHSCLAFFIIMYVECIIIGFVHYVYASFFIAAELTVIEKFF